MKNKMIFIILFMLAGLIFSNVTYAGEMDILLRKLVEKGILSNLEAQEIKTETSEEIKNIEKAQASVSGEPVKKDVLDWTRNIKLKGDSRLRYQYNHTNNGLDDRHRARVRLRLGAEGQVNDKLMAGIGLATGLSDGSADAARSTNATLADGFSKKPIALDYAYAKYAPYSWVEVIGGKFHNPLWMPTDLVWDGDINPEGGSVEFHKAINSKLDIFLTTGIFVLDESASASQNDDPMMYVLQPGFKYKVNDKVSINGAFTYNNSSNVKGNTLNGTAGTNSVSSGLKNNFIVLEPAIQVDIEDPLASTSIPILSKSENLSLFAQFVNNTIVSDENTGFALGFNLGAKKVAKFGDWQFKYIYAMLEKDAVLDILPDSDRFGGKTGVRSHEGIVTFGLGKNTSLGLDIYRSWGIISSKSAETLVQVDWNVKF